MEEQILQQLKRCVRDAVAKGETRYRFAKRIGVNPSTLSRFMDERPEKCTGFIDVLTAVKIAAGVGRKLRVVDAASPLTVPEIPPATVILTPAPQEARRP